MIWIIFWKFCVYIYTYMHAYLSTHYQSRPGLAYLSPQTLSIYDEIFQRSSFYETCRQGLLSLISLHPAGLHSFLFFSGYSEVSRSQVFSTPPPCSWCVQSENPKDQPHPDQLTHHFRCDVVTGFTRVTLTESASLVSFHGPNLDY